MVTLRVDGAIEFEIDVPEAETVEIVGRFDGWHEQAYPMYRASTGQWRCVLDPGAGAYLFRYRIDGERYRTDDRAHGVVRSHNGAVYSRVWRPSMVMESEAA